jgi:outer membrane protein assembly factor BamB
MKSAVLCLCFLVPIGIHAENWPQFRGPAAQGRSSETDVPIKWSASENVAWKTALPGESWSSPIVWQDTIFVTTATDEGKSCRVLALDRNTGDIRWNQEVFRQSPGHKEGRNTYATPTPATDGQRVYSCFFDGSFTALDFSGKLVWTNRSYPFYSQHGLGTSPILYADLLIMARDGSSQGEDKGLGWQRPWDQAFIIALDTRTGQERWKAHRGLSRIAHGVPTIWSAPDGHPELVSEAGDVVQGFDPRNGQRLWTSQVIGEGKVPSTVVGGRLVYTAGGWGGRESIKAFKIGGQGELGTNNLVWEQKGIMPKVPSMLHLEGRLFAVTDNGTATCFKADTGEILWKERLGGNFSASPVTAGGRVYFTSDNGETTVVEAAPQFPVLAKNAIGEKVQASLAISHGQIFIRTEKHLFAIGEKSQ